MFSALSQNRKIKKVKKKRKVDFRKYCIQALCKKVVFSIVKACLADFMKPTKYFVKYSLNYHDSIHCSDTCMICI